MTMLKDKIPSSTMDVNEDLGTLLESSETNVEDIRFAFRFVIIDDEL